MVIEKARLKVGVRGAEPVLDGELFAHIKPDDCYWNIADGRVLEITLQKVWRSVNAQPCKHVSWPVPPQNTAPTSMLRVHATC